MSTMELPPKTDLYAEDQSDDKSDDKPDDKSDEMSAALLMENRAKADAMSVNIRAPSTLPGGYELTVEIDGKQLTVLVPNGGVKIGELFRAQVLHRVELSKFTTDSQTSPNIPMFHWRDGLCDCCAYGWCHPLFCLSIWFTPLALVQVMTRLNLDLCADPSTAARERKFWTNFKIMLVILIVYFIIDLALSAVITATGTQTPVLVLIKVVVRTVFGLYVLIVACKTRSSIRRRDRIPEETCVGCEDCCVAYWCTFCTVAQMARHTADYGIYGAACCTETGLVENTAPAKSLSHVV